MGLENNAIFHVFFRYNFLTKYNFFHFSYIMNKIGFIEFAYGKIKYIFNAVLKCESFYLARVLFYFI